jgi:uncharacterized protein
MSSEANKAIVRRFWETFSAGRLDEALSLMSDDATWWIAGNPKKFALAGTKTKAEFRALVEELSKLAPGGLHVTPKAFTAEGDRVAVEAVSHAELSNGRVYANEYHFLIEVREGKIRSVREYLDTMHTKEIFVDP